MPKPLKDQKLVSPKNSIDIDYFELLNMIDAELIRGCDVETIDFDTNPGRYYWIRHDVDHCLRYASQMAVREHEHGIKSTYFILNTAPYWQSSEDCLFYSQFVSWGHDLGIHNNAVASYVYSPRTLPFQIIQTSINRLDIYSDILLTSSHGDKLCRQYGFNNYEMWFECPYEYRKADMYIPGASLTMMGLQEVYFMRRDAYLSDTGHTWRGWAGPGSPPPFEVFDPYIGPMETIERFNQMDSGVLQLLVHPCWWEVA